MPPVVDEPAPTLVDRLLTRMDRLEERASEERGKQAEQFGERLGDITEAGDRRAEALGQRIEDEAKHAQAAAKALVDGVGQRVTDLGAALDRRIGDLVAEQRAGRKELRWLMMVLLLINAGLSGLNLWIKADGSVGVAPVGTMSAEVDEPTPEPLPEGDEVARAHDGGLMP